MDIVNQISEELNVSSKQIQTVLDLLKEGNTIPFIARYRKELTGALSDEILRKIDDRNNYLTNLYDRMQTIISSINEQGKLDDELKLKIESAQTLTELEDLYRPYKPKRKTRASVAIEKGLKPIADYLLNQIETIKIEEYAKEFINPEKGLNSIEEVLQGAEDIIAEIISDNADYRKYIRKQDYQKGFITTKEIKPEEKGTYDMYADYSEAINKIVPHRILAINRAEKQKYIKVKLALPDEININFIISKVIKKNSPFKDILELAINDSYSRLISPSVENEIRSDLTEKAEEISMEVFKANLHQLLLASPLKNMTILGFDPGYVHGCKLAVIDKTGKVLDTKVIYPTKPREQIESSKKIVKELIIKHNIDYIALGNGTASRESEKFLRDLLKEIETIKCCKVIIVSESGASVYSATKLAQEEFPQFDVNLRSAVSIARRLQDPLAELVKIPPEAIGVGQYQHDMNQKRLNEVLSGVVENCVNSVGVDVNSASPSLLTYVAGINQTIAANIVSYREKNGEFKNREELLNVPKLGNKSYTQCAGFLRISNGYPLDNTAVHPESYPIVNNLLNHLGLKLEDIDTLLFKEKLDKITNIESLSKDLGVGDLTLSDIIDELKRPGRDIRQDNDEQILNNDVLEITDLKEGMILKGTVRNIMDFGCFVDIGVHVDGLVHISELADKFVKHPLDVVSLNQIVKVKVISIDVKKKRIGLSIKQA